MSLDEKELNNEIPQNLLALFRTMPTKKELEQATLADVEVF